MAPGLCVSGSRDRKFPCSGPRIPCSARKIPCNAERISPKIRGACQGQELQNDLPFPWHARSTVRGSPPVGLPRSRPYYGRPSGHRSGSPTSPPPPLIRPCRRLLRRSRRLSGPGPHIDWSVSAHAAIDACQLPTARSPSYAFSSGPIETTSEIRLNSLRISL